MSAQYESSTRGEIDLKEVILYLWGYRMAILSSTASGLVLFAIYAFLIAKPTFVSSALLLPTESQGKDQLGAAAALLGKKPTGNKDADLYQSLLTSRTVIHKLLATKLPNLDDSANGRLEPLCQILGIDTTKPKVLEKATEDLSKSIKVNTKESDEGGILEITFASHTPWLSQEIGNTVMEIGQEELRIVRSRRFQIVISRLEEASKEAQMEWDSSAQAVTDLRDKNRSIILPEQMLALSRLEIEKQAKEQKYLLIRKEYELQKLERAKAAPPMMILDPANLPARKSKPKRALLMAIGMILGAFGSSVGLLMARTIRNNFQESAPA